MKRKFKRIASLVLAAVMVFAMAVPAMAAESWKPTDNYTITITGVTDAGHTFKAYQIFSGDVYDADGKGEANEEILSNIEWGSSLQDANGQKTLASKVIDSYDGTKTYTAKEVADALSKKDAADLEEIFKAVTPYLGSVAGTTDKKAEDSGNYVINELGAGYYLVIDDADAILTGTDTAYSSFIVEVVGNATVKTKAKFPEVTKKVKDINDSQVAADGTNPTGWQDSADYDIGNEIEFKLEGTIADNYADYKAYYYEFVDTAEHLTYKADSIEVTISIPGEDPLTVEAKGPGNPYGYELSVSGHNISIKFADLKQLSNKITKDSVITIEYKATLDADAVMGNPGNQNKVHLKYSNNPQDTYDGTGENPKTGETPDDIVFVFTFDIDVDKVEQVIGADGQPETEVGGKPKTKPLKGAEFTLQKYNAADDTWIDITKQTITGDEAETKFNFKGIDDGIYRLKETKTPNGYNTLKPDEIYFEVTATHSEAQAADGMPITVTALSATVGTWNEDTNTFTNGGEGSGSDIVVFETNKNDLTAETIGGAGAIGSYGWLASDVLNNHGTTLPETGGIGTTIFYVVGSVLVLGAVILLVTKRRMKSE